MKFQAVRNAITHRIAHQHIELLREYGLDAVSSAIMEQAASVGPVEEIGSSDISCWVNEIKQHLEHSKRSEG